MRKEEYIGISEMELGKVGKGVGNLWRNERTVAIRDKTMPAFFRVSIRRLLFRWLVSYGEVRKLDYPVGMGLECSRLAKGPFLLTEGRPCSIEDILKRQPNCYCETSVMNIYLQSSNCPHEYEEEQVFLLKVSTGRTLHCGHS